jgi:hypothetical protein
MSLPLPAFGERGVSTPRWTPTGGFTPPARLVFSLLLALLAGPALAAEPRPVFVASAADGQAVRGTLESLEKDWAVRLGPKGAVVKGGELLSLRRADRELPPMPEDLHVILANGDRLPVEAPRLAGERLRFRHPDLGGGEEASLSLGAVALLWREPPAGADDPEALRRRLLADKRPRDVVLLGNGDRVEGTLNALDDKKLEVEADGKTTTLGPRQAAVLALSTELAETLRPKGVYAQVTLYGKDGGPGTRVSLGSAACDGTTLTGTTLFGAALRVPLDRVAALDLYQGRAVYLSDLKPASYEYVPYLDETWPLGVDATAGGRELRLGASVYAKGLGMHSRSRVTYRLDGGYKRFEATAGLDARTGREGAARVRVLADGKPLALPGDGELVGGKGPLAVGVDVAGVKELTLEVDYLRRGPVQGNVNWVDARLVK